MIKTGTFVNPKVLSSIRQVRALADVLVTERGSDDVSDVAQTVFTCDLFGGS